MDDEQTPHAGDPVPPPAPPPAVQPGPPPPPPAAVDRPGSAGGWQPPVEATPDAPRLDLPLIVGRTFDTFGREWSLFLALAVPAGVGGFASALLSQSFQDILRDPTAAAETNQLALIVPQLLVSLLGGLTTLGTIVATDRLWRGHPVGLGEALRGAVRLVPRAIGLLLVVFLLILVVVIGMVACLMLIGVLGPAGAFVGVLGVVVLFVLLLYASSRLSIAFPVLALEAIPVRSVVGRAWRLAGGHVLVLFGTALVIGLCSLFPAWGGTLFTMFVPDRIVAGIALGLATMVTAPLAGIWTVLAWAMLTRAPYLDSPVMTTGKGRVVGVAIVLGVGLVLMVIGAGLAGTGASELLDLTSAI
jgi:hypothetical protein